MYKVVIADDNPLVLDSLRSSIPWKDLDCEIAATVLDGTAALDRIRSGGVDLLVTDIKMPGMDGLTLAELLQERGAGCKVVIITGYGDLEYAKRALRAGASDFILKPIDDRELAEAVRRALSTVSADRRRLRSAALEVVVRRQGDTAVLEEVERSFGFFPRRAFFLRLLPRQKEQTVPIDPFPAGLFGEGVKLVEFRDGDGSTAAVFLESGSSAGAEEFRRAVAARTAASLARGDSRGFSLGVGRLLAINPDSGLAASLAGAITAAETQRFVLDFAGTRTLFEEDLAENPPALAELGRLLGRLERSSPDQTGDILAQLGGLPVSLGFIPAASIKDILKGGYLALLFRMEAAPPAGQPLPVPDVLCRRVDAAYGWTESLAPLKELLAARDADSREEGRSPLVRRAMELIAERYAENLGLEDAAGECGVSPGHLSRRLKAETGSTFSEILNRVRVFQAIRCLNSSTMKIYEAAAKVGFDNPAYFNQVFRRVTGKSPREYLSGA